MNILVVSNLYPPHVLGGYEILCEQVVENLRARGHTVHVLTSTHQTMQSAAQADRPHVTRALRLTVPFGRAPRRINFHGRWLSKHNHRVTTDLIRCFDPGLVFVWSQLRLTLGAARAAEQSGRAVCYTFNDMHPTGWARNFDRHRPRSMARWLLQRWFDPDRIDMLALENCTAISQTLLDSMGKEGVRPKNARVIYQGIPIDRFPLKAVPGSVHDPVRLLYVGQLQDYKGVHHLIAAAHLVASRRGAGALSVHIVGAGSDQYTRHLEQLARMGPAAVELWGKRGHEQVAQIYREHDIFAFPSIWEEPFGLAHLEAMASGTPVVATAQGGHGEFLVHEENALVYPSGDVPALARAIERLLDDPALCQTLAQQARECVERSFTLDRYVCELASWLEQVRRASNHPAARRD